MSHPRENESAYFVQDHANTVEMTRRDYDEIYQRALPEMQQADFLATWQFRTAWGKR